MADSTQRSLCDCYPSGVLAPEVNAAVVWERAAAKRSLDELFSLTLQYRASKAYQDLLRFVARFPSYSPFNAMLVHIQNPGAVFVAPPHRWLREYARVIKPGARPLVILRPMGPVMFVFDVSDTEPTENAPPLPPEVEKPFEMRKGYVGPELQMVIENAKRDGVRTMESNEGSQFAGSIGRVDEGVRVSQKFQMGVDEHRRPIFTWIPVRYDLLINGKLSPEAQYATIVHELAHLYCGHLGTPDERWWPNRQGLKNEVEEFEAESVAFLVCSRTGVDSPSERYLAGYVDRYAQTPLISLECVMKAAGLIETMSRQWMKPRKSLKEEIS